MITRPTRKRVTLGTAILALALSLQVTDGQTFAEKILLDATIDGKPVRLFFDTGASRCFLFLHRTRKLGLEFSRPPYNPNPVPGSVAAGSTAEYDLVVGIKRVRTSFGVVPAPPMAQDMDIVDGCIGWPLVQNDIFRIEAAERKVTWLTNVPPEASAWIKFKLRWQSPVLSMQPTDSEPKPAIFCLDSGAPHGIALLPERWREWRTTHNNQPRTLCDMYMPGEADAVPHEEMWATDLDFGPLRVTDVPVREANLPQMAANRWGFQAAFGLAALERLDLIVDGAQGFVYGHPKSTAPAAYEHNRLGAEFTSRDPMKFDFVAQVVAGSPGYEAGIRNGDALLKVGDFDLHKWRTAPTPLVLERYWKRPAGTKLDLTLRRGEETIQVSPVLRDILKPTPR